MKEAIANSYLVMLALTLMSIVMLLLVASLVYSKTYKVKNRIVNIMEKYGKYDTSDDSEQKKEIYSELSKIGYPINNGNETCQARPITDNAVLLHTNSRNHYDFCLYKIPTSRGYYFHVTVFTHYDIPIIGQYLRFPIEGDTRTVYSEVGG